MGNKPQLAPAPIEPVLSFEQFVGTSPTANPLLLAGLRTVAGREKHTRAAWVARLHEFGNQPA